MDMQVSSSTTQSTQTASSSQFQQVRSDFKDLADALKSGNLSAAQSAYADLQKNAPPGAQNDPNNPLAKVGQALQQGDLSAAQSAFKSGMHAHRGHGRRTEGSEQSAPATTSAIEATTTTSPSPATDTSGTLLNEVA